MFETTNQMSTVGALANDEIKGTMDGWRVTIAVAIH